MKLIFSILILISSIFTWAGDLEDGLSAYEKQDYKTALIKLRKLAEQGDDISQFYIGSMYRNGQGVVKDYKAAMRWYTMAAKQGNTEAMYNLGVMYANGEGVVKNYARGHMLIMEARQIDSHRRNLEYTEKLKAGQ